MFKNSNYNSNKNSDRNNIFIFLKMPVLEKYYKPIMFSNSQSLELQSQNFVFVVSKVFKKKVIRGLQFNFKLFTGVSYITSIKVTVKSEAL